MKQRTTKFSPNRRIVSDLPPETELKGLAKRISYGGSPQHKRNPGDFDLSPAAQPRRGKTLCDDAGIFKRAEATSLLKEGARRGMISIQPGAGGVFPAMIWAVTKQGIPVEAQLENPQAGTCHGYPMPERDAFRDEVLRLWRERQPLDTAGQRK